MNARTVSRKSIGVVLIVGLVALLPTVAVRAEARRAVLYIAPLADHCEVLFSEAGELFVPVDEAAAGCADLVNAAVRSVHRAGNTAWVQLEAGGQTEMRLFVNQGAVWEHRSQGSEPYPYFLYELAPEDVSTQELSFASAAPDAAFLYAQQMERYAQDQANLITSAARAATPDAAYIYAQQMERYAQDQASLITSAGEVATPDAAFLYAQQMERYAQDQENVTVSAAPSPRVSADPRGGNYWNELLTQPEEAFTATQSRAGTSSGSTVDPVALAEHEIIFSVGSRAKTLTELLQEMYGSAWPGTFSANEDLSRE